MSGSGDPGINLLTGQLSAFAWFRALGHLDLKLTGVYQIVAGYSESSGSHLLDRAVFGIAVFQDLEALWILAALAGVAAAANTVHGNRQSLVGFLAD